jgi:hypothetical protein
MSVRKVLATAALAWTDPLNNYANKSDQDFVEKLFQYGNSPAVEKVLRTHLKVKKGILKAGISKRILVRLIGWSSDALFFGRGIELSPQELIEIEDLFDVGLIPPNILDNEGTKYKIIYDGRWEHIVWFKIYSPFPIKDMVYYYDVKELKEKTFIATWVKKAFNDSITIKDISKTENLMEIENEIKNLITKNEEENLIDKMIKIVNVTFGRKNRNRIEKLKFHNVVISREDMSQKQRPLSTEMNLMYFLSDNTYTITDMTGWSLCEREISYVPIDVITTKATERLNKGDILVVIGLVGSGKSLLKSLINEKHADLALEVDDILTFIFDGMIVKEYIDMNLRMLDTLTDRVNFMNKLYNDPVFIAEYMKRFNIEYSKGKRVFLIQSTLDINMINQGYGPRMIGPYELEDKFQHRLGKPRHNGREWTKEEFERRDLYKRLTEMRNIISPNEVMLMIEHYQPEIGANYDILVVNVKIDSVIDKIGSKINVKGKEMYLYMMETDFDSKVRDELETYQSLGFNIKYLMRNGDTTSSYTQIRNKELEHIQTEFSMH